MFIDVVPNGRSASAVLLRESYREGSKVRKRTLANLSKLPASVVDGLRVLLQGGTAIARPEEVFEIQRSLPHGHVAAVIAMMRTFVFSSGAPTHVPFPTCVSRAGPASSARAEGIVIGRHSVAP